MSTITTNRRFVARALARSFVRTMRDKSRATNMEKQHPAASHTLAFMAFILPALLIGRANGQSTTPAITPVAPNDAFVFSPDTDVAVQFKISNSTDAATIASLTTTSFAGKPAVPAIEKQIKAKGETTLSFNLGRLAANFYRMTLKFSRAGKDFHEASYPLLVAEKQERQVRPPLLPVGVYVNAAKHLKNQSTVYANTYVHAMALNISQHHFTTVVLSEDFSPAQIALFGQYGLSVIVQSTSAERLGDENVIGGILAEDPKPEEVVPLMQSHETISAKVAKPLMIGVSGDLAGTKSAQSPMKLWETMWDELKKNATSIDELKVNVRRYWHYYPIEYGPSYPILQSYVYRGCLSFMDSMLQATSGLGYLKPLVRVKETEKADEEKKKKKKKEEVMEYFGQIPLWVKLQAFGTTRAQSVYKTPTPSQLQTMMHLALAHGAKGIMLDCYLMDESGRSGLVDPVTLEPTDGRLKAASSVAKLIADHSDLFSQTRRSGGALYSNAFVAPITLLTGSAEEDNLTEYLYVINLNTRMATSCWIYDLPRSLNDVVTGEKLKTEMYETRESSWWGLYLTLKPGEARIFELVNLLPTVHE